MKTVALCPMSLLSPNKLRPEDDFQATVPVTSPELAREWVDDLRKPASETTVKLFMQMIKEATPP